jgi:hypothetical protein
VTADVDEDTPEGHATRLFGRFVLKTNLLSPLLGTLETGTKLTRFNGVRPFSSTHIQILCSASLNCLRGTMRGEFEYRCEAATLEGFIQQLAASIFGMVISST